MFRFGYIVYNGCDGNSFWKQTVSALSRTLDIPRVRAVVGLRPPLLDGHTHKDMVRVPVQVLRRADKALANGRGPESKTCLDPLHSGGARGHTKWMAWLFLRASPSKQRFAVLHTGSKPARTPLPVPIRPRDPRVVCTAVVEKEMATSACAPVRVRLEPRDPDSRIDLVSRSSIDYMFKVFSESDVLTWSNLLSHPLTKPFLPRSCLVF